MIREYLLTRRGLVFLESMGNASADRVRALEIELADLGYVPSPRLHRRFERASSDELASFHRWALGVLAEHAGGGRKHEPLFRSFPDGIPTDTSELWWQKVVVHYLQSPQQPCLNCGETATTHVLSCKHVICDLCFDGASYSACPACEQHVDRSSPFFVPSEPLPTPDERVVFKQLDLRDDYLAEVRALFLGLCARKQALSPDDRALLVRLATAHAVLPWVPETIPVRENVALLFGTIAERGGDPRATLAAGRRFMTTATDVLRFVAVLSGKDGSLLPDEKKHRFRVAKLSRGLRRDLLGLLDGLAPSSLAEDMLRHREYWVWLGEFLHPHEHATRLPNVARAFAIVRKKAPDGTPAPAFQTWNARLEVAASDDPAAMLALLEERPGELARRLDWLLRQSSDRAAVVDAFVARLPRFATPVLVGLRSHLPRRLERARNRVYWPKAAFVSGVSATDARALLDPASVARLVEAIEAELLARFAKKPAFAEGVVDAALADVIVPFNERTASPSAVTLPRGSKVALPRTKLARLFMHWCEPEGHPHPSDLDLSVGFYDDAWIPAGVCSFYQLECKVGDAVVARSSGDLRSAPFPDGASEFVDIDREAAIAAGLRYAVMVVNNYDGLPFDRLERAFAGLMLRDDPAGAHFDPRTVALRFAIGGQNGIFLPLVLDLKEERLFWLDVQCKGQLNLNTVGTSHRSITRIGPEMLTYFASGTRPSMLDLAFLHAAARCRRVLVRTGTTTAEYVRGAEETVAAFHARLARGEADEPRARLSLGGPALAFVHHGDLDLPDGSAAYALFREMVVPTLAASDLLS